MAPHHQGTVPRRAGSEAAGADCDAAALAMSLPEDGVALALAEAAAAAGVCFALLDLAFACAFALAFFAFAVPWALAAAFFAFAVALGDAPEPAFAPEPAVGWDDGDGAGAGFGLGFGLGFGDEAAHLLAPPGAAPQSNRQPSTEPGAGL